MTFSSYNMVAGGFTSTYGLKNIITKKLRKSKILKPKLKRKKAIKFCKCCNKPLIGNQQKYCSPHCSRKILYKVSLQTSHELKSLNTTKHWCINCLKTLPHINKGMKYCSKECKREFHKKLKTGFIIPLTDSKLVLHSPP